MSQGLQCLGAWNVLRHAMSQGMQCLRACNVFGHGMSWGMQRPGILKSRASNILEHALSYCFRECSVSRHVGAKPWLKHHKSLQFF